LRGKRPVNADVPSLEAILVEEHDAHVNALGIKGVGEIGINGTAGAIANAVWHATGVRVHRFPITIEQLIGAGSTYENATAQPGIAIYALISLARDQAASCSDLGVKNQGPQFDAFAGQHVGWSGRVFKRGMGA
jgi:hypothetical protein